MLLSQPCSLRLRLRLYFQRLVSPPEGGVTDGAVQGEHLAQGRFVQFFMVTAPGFEPGTSGLLAQRVYHYSTRPYKLEYFNIQHTELFNRFTKYRKVQD